MTTNCKICGSSQVIIPAKSVSYVGGDLATQRSEHLNALPYDDVEYGLPRCAKCDAPREDISINDMDEIRSWV
jgi:hypothetical protein